MHRTGGLVFGLGSLFGAVFVACTGAPPPGAEAPPAPSGEASSPALARGERPGKPWVSDPAPAPNPGTNLPAAVVSAGPPAPAPLVPICLAKCERLVAKCGTPQVETCRLNCTKYDPPGDCADQTRAALECARDAKDLACANVAPQSCSPKFRAIAACLAGETQRVEAKPVGLPDGWERVTDAADGFSLALPRGSTDKAGAEGQVRSATATDGTSYTVRVLPPLKEKASEKSLLHFLMKVQGRCSDKVKLDGFIEKEGRSSIHFKAHCPDKTDWDGMIYITGKSLVLLSAQAGFGKIGATEPFFYQFEYLKP